MFVKSPMVKSRSRQVWQEGVLISDNTWNTTQRCLDMAHSHHKDKSTANIAHREDQTLKCGDVLSRLCLGFAVASRSGLAGRG